MIDLSHLRGQRIAVLGLARSGLAAARALLAAKVEVRAWDDSEPRRRAAAAEGVPVGDLADADFDRLVLSPGIPRAHPRPHPAVAAAEAAGRAVVSDIDLLAEAQAQAQFIGITGTNGKSTTTALIGHILGAAGLPVAVGGNLGIPACSLPALGGDGWYVLELSSYQLETIAAVPWSVGVWLNISPDHLDRYAGMDDYVAAKRRLFLTPAPSATAVVGVDDDWSRATRRSVARDRRWRVVPVSVVGEATDGVFVQDGILVDDTGGAAAPVMNLADAPALPGRHNWQNAAAAYGAARAVGLPPPLIAGGLASFPGLRHRQEQVAVIDGIRFINDSKATNAEAAAKALACYDPIYWIAGGRPKPGPFDELAPWLGRVARAYLIGEATSRLEAFLAGRVPATPCGSLAAAVEAAHAEARREGRPGAVVLLSPACASFDQFTDFEARGDAFVAAVRRLQTAPAEAGP